MAVHMKIGWILSGPVDRQEASVNFTLTATHTLRVDIHPVKQNLDDQLRRSGSWSLSVSWRMSRQSMTSLFSRFHSMARGTKLAYHKKEHFTTATYPYAVPQMTGQSSQETKAEPPASYWVQFCNQGSTEPWDNWSGRQSIIEWAWSSSLFTSPRCGAMR